MRRDEKGMSCEKNLQEISANSIVSELSEPCHRKVNENGLNRIDAAEMTSVKSIVQLNSAWC